MGISMIWCVECQKKDTFRCTGIGKHEKHLITEKGWSKKRGLMMCPDCFKKLEANKQTRITKEEAQ